MSLGTPTCAIWMVTYNHAAYIRTAIESVVHQKTEFSFKLIIGDDKSTDETSSICKELADRYPDQIDLITHPQNMGSQANGIDTYKRCFSSGAKYVAILEGDDYWSDPYKLQTQLKFLESNPGFVGCFSNSEERFEKDNNRASSLYCDFPSAKSIGFKDLSFSNLIPTCSVVFRNNLFGGFPQWYYELKMGDWPLHLLNCQFGDYWYIPKVMGVHRHHSTSIWMSLDMGRINGYLLEAYDIMIKGFSVDPIYSEYLTKGKEQFLKEIEVANKKRGYKDKVKSLLINTIKKI